MKNTAITYELILTGSIVESIQWFDSCVIHNLINITEFPNYYLGVKIFFFAIFYNEQLVTTCLPLKHLYYFEDYDTYMQSIIVVSFLTTSLDMKLRLVAFYPRLNSMLIPKIFQSLHVPKRGI